MSLAKIALLAGALSAPEHPQIDGVRRRYVSPEDKKRIEEGRKQKKLERKRKTEARRRNK